MKFTEMNKRCHIITFFIIVAITFGIYSNSLKNEFIDYWDDNNYVTGNELIKSLKLENLKLNFSSFYLNNYHPITSLSYAIEYHFWGLNPLGYHITNVFINSLNAFLIFLIIKTITRNVLAPFIASIIFIIHPINVETVAWVSERKNLLSFFFFLAAFYLYIKSHDSKYRSFYLISLIVYILASLSKSAVVIFPFMLLLYDFCFTNKKLKVKIIDKIPFLTISCMTSIITMTVISESQMFASYHVNLYPRILSALRAFAIYIGKYFLPINLSNRYFYDISTSILDWRVIISVIILSLMIFFTYKSFKHDVVIFFCIVWFFITLIPVSNIIQGPHWLADRYLYFPSLSYSLFVANLFSKVNQGSTILDTNKKRIAFSILILVICFYSFLTIKRNYVWKDSITLWEDCVKKNPGSALVHTYLGGSYMKKGLKKEAFEELKKAIDINPRRANDWANLAYIDIDNGRLNEAMEKVKFALLCEGDNYEAHNALAIIYMHKRKFNRAINEFKWAIELHPESIRDFLHIYKNLGVSYHKIDQNQDAITALNKALKFDPDDYEVNLNLAMIYSFYVNDKKKAIYYFGKIVRLGHTGQSVDQIRARINTMDDNKKTIIDF